MDEVPAGSQATGKLEKRHQRSTFASGEAALDAYLQRRAGQEQRRRVAATFVIGDGDEPERVVGYYTLSAISIGAEGIDAESARRLPRYPQIPAILLGRLAVDRSRQGTGLGRWLLLDALFRAYRQSGQIGAWTVVVDAIDDDSVAFHEHFGFTPFHGHPHRLYLPMSVIAKL